MKKLTRWVKKNGHLFRVTTPAELPPRVVWDSTRNGTLRSGGLPFKRQEAK